MIIITGDTKEEGDLEDIPEIKKYFMRIFTVLSKEIRDKLNQLELDKEKKKKVKKELVFLPKEKQGEYLEELNNKTYNKIN
ncbi:MAG: hypothetical protein ACFFC3_01290 [Candidatus Odinarchaeota archaeon]